MYLLQFLQLKKVYFHFKLFFDKRPESVFVKFDGLDEAIIGFEDSSERLIYSVKECIGILSRDMGYEEAIEFFDYNVRNSHIGNKTPILCEDNF